MGNFAAVDCGSLSTRLLISNGRGEPILRLTRVTGLGQGVDLSRALLPTAIERSLAVLGEYRALMDHHGVQAVRMVGTSALRDANNRESFSNAAAEVIGTGLSLISGEEEASLSFLGATAELSGTAGPWLVADIGGGSTELVVGPQPFGACSLEMGCVRVTERFLHEDPPSPLELSSAAKWLTAQCRQAEAEVPALRSAATLVGLAGTVSALACFDQGLESYQQHRVHHYRLHRHAVERALDDLAARPAARRPGLPGIDAARAPVIVAGTLVLATLMVHFGFDECVVSEADLLDGLVLSLVGRDVGTTCACPRRSQPQ